ncbi:MAG: branched-chain amino acid ABC transporter ATP-binding protein/permease [Elainellaceae cyanobacterium]
MKDSGIATEELRSPEPAVAGQQRNIKPQMPKLLQFLPAIVALVLLALLPAFVDLFTLVNSTYYLTCGLLALSLSFVWGVGGIFSFGQTVFYGMAGYTYGVIGLNIPGAFGTLLGLVGGVVVAIALSAILGYFMFYGQVGSLYIAIITLASTLILYNLMGSTSGDQYRIGEAALGGFNGMQRVPTLLDLDVNLTYYLVLIASVAALGGLTWLLRQRFGRVFSAVRVNESRTELLGYDIRGVKLAGFVISGAIAGLAGVLFTSWGNTINPTVFDLGQGTLIAIWVMVGGRSKLWGAFLGAVVIQSLSNYLGTFAQGATPIVLGIVLILLVLLLPEGIAPALQQLWHRVVPPTTPYKLPAVVETEVVAPHQAIEADYTLLKAEGLKRRFGSFWAVQGIDLEFKAGQAYCIVGPNGAGKSTFFNLLTGRLAPTEGQILYNGRNITALMPHERARRGISIKLQVPNVYQEFTVYDNLWLATAIRYPGERERKQHMAMILDEIGLRDRLDVKAGELSHGEKQWLEIGMAAVTNPSLMLLDEPTGGMSRGETLRTVELVKRLSQRSTVIVVEHDMEFVRQLGASVTVFAQGQVFAQGSIEQIQQDERVLEIYLGKAHA